DWWKGVGGKPAGCPRRLARDYSTLSDDLGQARLAERPRRLLDVALVPEGEGEEAPELPASILPSGDVLVDEPRDHLRREEPVPPQRVGRQRVPSERLELSAQPGRRRDREAALPAVDDRMREERLHGTPEQHLLREAAHLVPVGQREREVRDNRIAERDARLERMRHRGA